MCGWRPDDGSKAVLETKAAAVAGPGSPPEPVSEANAPDSTTPIIPAVANLSIAPLTAPPAESKVVDERALAGGPAAPTIADPQERALLEPPVSVTESTPAPEPEPAAAPVRPPQTATPQPKKAQIQARPRNTKNTRPRVARSNVRPRTTRNEPDRTAERARALRPEPDAMPDRYRAARGEPERTPERARNARGEPRVVRRWVEYYDERGSQVDGPSPVTTYPRAEEPGRPTFWRY
jgi:hypothetical protein